MTGRVVVVGLGPAGPELVPTEIDAAIGRIATRFLRTSRHPAAVAVPDAVSFDDVYEREPTLEEVYAVIVDELAAAAAKHGEVLYAVPGSPNVAERTVQLLLASDRVEVDVLPAPSFLDLAWARLGVDPIAASVRLVDGRSFAVDAAGERGPLLVAQTDTQAVLSEVKLAVDADPSQRVTVLQRLGLADEAVYEVPWADLDRAVDPDHLTSLYVASLAAPVAVEIQRFVELVALLRRECPWDREQTHRSLRRHLIEETYEVLEAIDHLDDGPEGYELLEEELGDLLFQVVFHATLAAEEGRFELADVARGIHDKLHGRHPHVFGDVEVGSAEGVVRNWDRIKAVEKGRESILEGIPEALPALLAAQKTQKRAASAGIDAGADRSVTEAAGLAGEPPSEAEAGEVLWAVVDWCRRADVDAETALRGACARARERIASAERARP